MQGTLVNQPSVERTAILLLVSDPLMRTVLTETLERAGYLVLAAGDLGKAVDWLKDCVPDLLIVRPDIDSMPGHSAAIYLRTKCHGIDVLMVGGLMDDDRLLNREELEGFAIFPAPFPGRQLLDKVKEILHHKLPK